VFCIFPDVYKLLIQKLSHAEAMFERQVYSNSDVTAKKNLHV